LINIMYSGTHVNYTIELINGMKINVLQPNTFTNFLERNTTIYTWWEKADCLVISENNKL
ncbi:MAG: TOBE domain-containing protein, partial [Dolichospermum sp.]